MARLSLMLTPTIAKKWQSRKVSDDFWARVGTVDTRAAKGFRQGL
jgi:hypothetical protein